jgi:hypothetical protein
LGKYQFTLREVHQQLLEDGFKISLNTVACYRQALGLKVALAVKQINTTIQKKYSYKPQGLDIKHTNHVWSTISKLQVAWFIWLPLLIGIAKYLIRDLCINRNNHQKPTFHPLGDFLNPALAL